MSHGWPRRIRSVALKFRPDASCRAVLNDGAFALPRDGLPVPAQQPPTGIEGGDGDQQRLEQKHDDQVDQLFDTRFGLLMEAFQLILYIECIARGIEQTRNSVGGTVQEAALGFRGQRRRLRVDRPDGPGRRREVRNCTVLDALQKLCVDPPCTQKHGSEQKPHEQGKTQNPVERPVKLRVRSFRRPPKPQVPDDDDRDHTRQHRACHDFAKRELQPQRNAGKQCERRELFKQVVERVEDLTRGQGHPDAYRLNRELGSLCDRDHAVEGARQREHRQGLFQVLCGDRVRAFVDPVARPKLADRIP